MGRRLFGARKSGPGQGTADWPQLPSIAGSGEGGLPPLPLPPPLVSADVGAPAAPEEELLERIVGFRGAVSDSLYENSKDYRMLCNLSQADLSACDEIVAELRRRLAGNIHFEVLAKLDDAHALVVTHLFSRQIAAEAK